MKLLTLLLLLGTVQSFALSVPEGDDMQQRRITGRIVDNDGAALPGVNVLEKGTINGAITDADGRFAITVASEKAVLSFSFIGFVTQEITVGAQTTIDVTLRQMVSALDEIVVVGYSTQARKSLTGAVSTVDAATLSESAATNPITRLQGKVAGVTILNQHTPGEGSTIRIRGMTTINDANPLYVVDGVAGGNYSPNDVESITILKDAAAQSIYGARAANGVVLVTTKGGKKNQKVTMNVNVRQGINKPAVFTTFLIHRNGPKCSGLRPKNANITELQPCQFGNGATPVIPYYTLPDCRSPGRSEVLIWHYMTTNWLLKTEMTHTLSQGQAPVLTFMAETTRNAPFKEYTIDIAGGTQNTTYAFMLGYTDDEGIFKYTGFERYSFRANVNYIPGKMDRSGYKSRGTVYQ